jgi:hypothetical protein
MFGMSGEHQSTGTEQRGTGVDVENKPEFDLINRLTEYSYAFVVHPGKRFEGASPESAEKIEHNDCSLYFVHADKRGNQFYGCISNQKEGLRWSTKWDVAELAGVRHHLAILPPLLSGGYHKEIQVGNKEWKFKETGPGQVLPLLPDNYTEYTQLLLKHGIVTQTLNDDSLAKINAKQLMIDAEAEVDAQTTEETRRRVCYECLTRLMKKYKPPVTTIKAPEEHQPVEEPEHGANIEEENKHVNLLDQLRRGYAYTCQTGSISVKKESPKERLGIDERMPFYNNYKLFFICAGENGQQAYGCISNQQRGLELSMLSEEEIKELAIAISSSSQSDCTKILWFDNKEWVFKANTPEQVSSLPLGVHPDYESFLLDNNITWQKPNGDSLARIDVLTSQLTSPQFPS